MLDVLIVGGGPVGMMLGVELARRGISFEIAESKLRRDRYCKALGVAPRTLEILDILGLLEHAHRLGMYFAGMNVVGDGKLLHRFNAQDDSLPYGHLGLAQPDIEDILEGCLGRHGYRASMGKTLVRLEQDSAQVIGVFDDGSELRARYLVACDGAHSTVRKQLQIPFEGERFERTFVLGDVHLDWDRPHNENWQFILSENGELRNVVVVIANPTAPGRYRISTSVGDDEDCPEQPSLEFLSRLIGPALPAQTKITDLRWSSRYSISHRLAATYRQGRVFLAGDAAHIHPPIGGLGMNTGLQDAFNLGWKLAAVCSGELPESVLDTYHAERHPVGQKVVEVTAARMRRTMGEPPAPEPEGFDTQLGIRYEPGLLVAAPGKGLVGPKTGERMPSLELSRPRSHGRIRTAELVSDGRFHLFSYLDEVGDFQRVAEAALGEAVRVWEIHSQEGSDLLLNYFLDQASEWRGTFGPGVVLVRPDSVIAWRGREARQLESWLSGLKRR